MCRSGVLTQVLDLGTQFVSDFVPARKVKAGIECPIVLDKCGRCGLVQQRFTASQEFLYSRHYWYRSGTTATMRAALADVVAAATRTLPRPLEPGDIVLDVGSNDGTLLRCYPDRVLKVGCEPAKNLHEPGRVGVDCLIEDFWSAHAYADAVGRMDIDPHRGNKAKVVTAIGMFYDLEDPVEFLRGIADVLDENGVFVAQLQCLKQTIELGDVGNFCHEHLEFYTLPSLQKLFNYAGMELFDVEENVVNGGSYRVFARLNRSCWQLPAGCTDRTWEMFRQDTFVTHPPKVWPDLLDRMTLNRSACVNFLRAERAAGKSVWVYGASTKGNVILQWYGLDSSVVTGAADRNPEKWGKFTVGTGVPITDEESMRKARPDYLLVLPYSFLEEFLSREKGLRDSGTKFVVPLPEFKVI